MKKRLLIVLFIMVDVVINKKNKYNDLNSTRRPMPETMVEL